MTSLGQFLDEVARQGSWMGGGSAAAFSAALAAALLEKLSRSPTNTRRLRAVRRVCTAAIEADANMFAQVITAVRAGKHARVARALKAATEVPCQVYEGAWTIRRIGQQMSRTIPPKFHADVSCAMAFGAAASKAARALIRANCSWLNDAPYAARIRRRLQRARHGP